MDAKLNYQELMDQHLKILSDLQYASGLFAASSKEVSTGYDKSWLRDNFYECLAFEVLGDWDTVEKTYDAVLSIFLKHESKIDWAIANKPSYRHEYIHARFHPETFEEFWEEWGNKQNDSIGAILYQIGEIESRKAGSILESDDHIRITEKLVRYLASIEYWHDRDSGMWEENEEVHASSVGACVAGLKSVARLKQIEVDPELISKGEDALNTLLPRESQGKFVDLAQLSLIYPYNVVTKEQADQILEHLEYHLLRERGVIRYKNDYYYNRNQDGYSEEAEWTFGLAWLAIIHEQRGDHEKAQQFLDTLTALDTERGIPELYFSNSPEYNENTPLGWSESLFIVALYRVNKMFIEGRHADPSVHSKKPTS
ncbi:MAG: Glycosyl hydrolases family 15 [candidate division WS6 bacterium OLB20]|uniref:Glycosyl hydrolases family 15 n=1 Tax=candidate division WS6 bacterium OLB20 TaxID=1617426 RepID=A0A136M0E7_9BACT|nr:MAG: Glycosyl hydrolases family 15 [candidate division WS6 bacterium OLB20]